MNNTLAVATREKLGLAMDIVAAMTTLGPSIVIVVSGAPMLRPDGSLAGFLSDGDVMR